MAVKRFLRVIWLASIFLVLADVTYADSDGYYCVGHDFIAYQFGFAAPPVGPHRLFVVRFGGSWIHDSLPIGLKINNSTGTPSHCAAASRSSKMRTLIEE